MSVSKWQSYPFNVGLPLNVVFLSWVMERQNFNIMLPTSPADTIESRSKLSKWFSQWTSWVERDWLFKLEGNAPAILISLHGEFDPLSCLFAVAWLINTICAKASEMHGRWWLDKTEGWSKGQGTTLTMQKLIPGINLQCSINGRSLWGFLLHLMESRTLQKQKYNTREGRGTKEKQEDTLTEIIYFKIIYLRVNWMYLFSETQFSAICIYIKKNQSFKFILNAFLTYI